MKALEKRLNLLNIERQFRPQSSLISTVKQRQDQFRKSLIQVYQSAAIGYNGLWCMISGLWLPSDSVVAAHLLSRTQELVSKTIPLQSPDHINASHHCVCMMLSIKEKSRDCPCTRGQRNPRDQCKSEAIRTG